MSIASGENVGFSYLERNEEGQIVRKVTALSGLDFEIIEGEFLAILGRNGSGKSTLAKHLNALLTPEEGTVFVDGMDTRDQEKIIDVRRVAGMVFQNPDNQIIGQIVDEDVAFGPENLGVPSEEIAARVEDSLSKVDMLAKRGHSPSKLSGGQKQRVSIAGILAMKPKILLMDEPTAMLDPKGRREVLSAVHALNRNEGITVVLITHDMTEAAGADRIIVMDRGSILMTGSPREIFARSTELEAIGLDVPLTARISAILKTDGINMKSSPITREELVRAVMSAAKNNT